jgi:WD40 repeat protein
LLAVSEGINSETTALSVWQLATGRSLYTIKELPGPPTFLTFSPDGKVLAGSCYDGNVRTWEAMTGRPKLTLEGTAKPMWCVGISPDNKLIAGADAKGVVSLWDCVTGQLRKTFNQPAEWPGPGGALVFAADGDTLLVHQDRTISIWNVREYDARN